MATRIETIGIGDGLERDVENYEISNKIDGAIENAGLDGDAWPVKEMLKPIILETMKGKTWKIEKKVLIITSSAITFSVFLFILFENKKCLFSFFDLSFFLKTFLKKMFSKNVPNIFLPLFFVFILSKPNNP